MSRRPGSQENTRPQPALGTRGQTCSAAEERSVQGQTRPGKPCSAPKTKVKVLCPGSPRQGPRGSNAPCSHRSGPPPAGQPLTAGSRPVPPRRHRTSRRGRGRVHTGGLGHCSQRSRSSPEQEQERPTTLPPSQKQRRCAAPRPPAASLPAPAPQARPRTPSWSGRAPTPAPPGPRALRRRPYSVLNTPLVDE